MTYLFKLAQRLAKIRFPFAVGVLGALGCGKGEKTEFLAPNPNQNSMVLNSIRVEPQVSSVRVGSELQFTATGYTASGVVVPVIVDWSAAGGIVTADGRYTGVLTGSFVVRATARQRASVTDSARVGVWDNTTDLVALVVAPDSAVIEVGDTLNFTAALQMASGAMTGSASVNWSASGGQVSADGRFTSSAPGQFEVSALSVNNLRGSARVLVQEHAQTLTRIRLTPKSATVLPGDSAQFAATADYDDGSTGTADVEWQSTGGTIVAGLFTATSGGGQYSVIARDRNGTLADTALVSVPAPTLVRLVVSPTASSLVPGAVQQFSAQAQMSDNSFQSVPLVWQATAGVIGADGVFRAGDIGGTALVIVTSPGSSVADTAVVTIEVPQDELAQMNVNPSSSVVPAGGFRQFTASGVWTSGKSSTPAVTWTATGGTITPSGLFTAGFLAGTYSATATASNGRSDTGAIQVTQTTLTSLQLSPSSSSKQPGQSQQFSASGVWSDGSTAAPLVTYSAGGGTITGGGLYVAGSTAGTFSVIATQQGGSLSDTSLVTISTPAPTLTGVVLAPTTAVLAPGGVQQFTAVGLYSNGSTGSISITWSETGGSINSTGRYTAGSTPGTYRVIARQSGNTLADTSVVTITSPPAVTSVTISPKPVSMQVGTTVQFSASATWSDGSTTVPPIVWTATGGTINASGLYTGGSTPGTFRAVATHQGGTKSDTAVVTLSAAPVPAPTLIGLVVAPKPASVAVNTTRQFNVGALWSDGSGTVPAITWAATGGTISSSGLYAAGPTTGTFWVIASGGAKADTSIVTVNAPSAATLTALSIAPDLITLVPGETQFYLPQAQWSDGSTTVPTLSWSATGGTAGPMGSGGLYTAGSTGGTFRVIASGGGKADTAQVIISGSAATLTSLSISPKPATVQTGATQQFSVGALWSDGGTTPPAVTWSATGGSINSSGLYTAGSTAGTFRAIATGGGKADTSVVTLSTAPVPTVTSFLLAPASATVAAGGTRQFSTTIAWSDGASHPATVSYSATGGTVTGTGMFTAGSVAGTFAVIASCSCGAADTSAVSVTVAGPATLTTLQLTPTTFNVVTGSTQALTLNYTWSDGSSAQPPVTYVTTGGIVNAGVYFAPVTTGNYQIIVSHTGGTLKDTSFVTVVNPTPPSLLYPNRPSGFSTVTELDFSQNIPAPNAGNEVQIGTTGWWVPFSAVGNLAKENDGSSPNSPGSVWRVTMPAGSYGGGVVGAGGGTGFGDFGTPLNSVGGFHTEVYVSVSVKWDSNFEWHPVSNKFIELDSQGLQLLAQSKEGGWPAFNPTTTTPGWRAAALSLPVTLGVWHTIEMYVKYGAESGAVKTWVDGTLITDATGLNIPASGGAGSGNWQDFVVRNFRGGGGEIKTRDSFMWYDHIYVAAP